MYKENLMVEKLREKFVEIICEKHYDSNNHQYSKIITGIC